MKELLATNEDIILNKSNNSIGIINSYMSSDLNIKDFCESKNLKAYAFRNAEVEVKKLEPQLYVKYIGSMLSKEDNIRDTRASVVKTLERFVTDRLENPKAKLPTFCQLYLSAYNSNVKFDINEAYALYRSYPEMFDKVQGEIINSVWARAMKNYDIVPKHINFFFDDKLIIIKDGKEVVISNHYKNIILNYMDERNIPYFYSAYKEICRILVREGKIK